MTRISWNSQPLGDWAKAHAQGEMIPVGGDEMHYLRFGSGPNLVMIHGFYLDSYMWQRNVQKLAEHFCVYVPDLWGFGYSSRRKKNCSYQLYADQIIGFMDAVGIGRASVMGQSMGGGTAMLLTIQNPSRVDKLVLVDSAGLPAKTPLTSKFFQLPGVGEFLLNWDTRFIRKMNLANFWLHESSLLTEEFLENATRFQKIRGTHEAMLAILRSGMFYTLSDQIPKLAELDIPTLIIWGREDRAIPLVVGERLRDLLPNAQWAVLDEAGHLPNYEKAEEFNRLAGDFLLTGKISRPA